MAVHAGFGFSNRVGTRLAVETFKLRCSGVFLQRHSLAENETRRETCRRAYVRWLRLINLKKVKKCRVQRVCVLDASRRPAYSETDTRKVARKREFFFFQYLVKRVETRHGIFKGMIDVTLSNGGKYRQADAILT